MKFRIEIDCENAAFTHNLSLEITRILSLLARTLSTSGPIEAGNWSRQLRDINGNRVGRAEFVEGEQHAN